MQTLIITQETLPGIAMGIFAIGLILVLIWGLRGNHKRYIRTRDLIREYDELSAKSINLNGAIQKAKHNFVHHLGEDPTKRKQEKLRILEMEKRYHEICHRMMMVQDDIEELMGKNSRDLF